MRNSKRNQLRKKGKNRNKEFAIVTYSFLALFIALTVYFIYFVQVKSSDFINSPYNARLETMKDKYIRGRILSSDGTILASSSVDETGEETRSYPYANVFAHAIGYDSNGMAGVELESNFNLLQSHSFIIKKLGNEILGYKNQGDDVVTTFDLNLQQACYNTLGSQEGAVICLEPSTGKVLAMVSKPDYNPNSIQQNWDSYVSDSDSSVLLNRATQGLYAPGSTFKMVTLMSYLQQKGTEDYSFTCDGSYTFDEHTMHCYNNKAHGEENLSQAFSNSCNSAFSEIGVSLNAKEFAKLGDKLLFNKQLPTRIKMTSKSRLRVDENTTPYLMMQTAIGQGETMVSPLHMAMLASAIAKDGVLMEPYVVESIQNENGVVVKAMKPERYGQLLSKETAKVMQNYMRSVVTEGTATQLMSESYEAYGKTGTADFGSDINKNHSWFVGFAKNDAGKEIAIAVVVEKATAGHSYGVPFTKQILDYYFAE